jgi:predicted Zn-dependent peptidase
MKNIRIIKIDLNNGIRLLVREDHNLPIVTIRASFLAGVRAENENNLS